MQRTTLKALQKDERFVCHQEKRPNSAFVIIITTQSHFDVFRPAVGWVYCHTTFYAFPPCRRGCMFVHVDGTRRRQHGWHITIVGSNDNTAVLLPCCTAMMLFVLLSLHAIIHVEERVKISSKNNMQNGWWTNSSRVTTLTSSLETWFTKVMQREKLMEDKIQRLRTREASFCRSEPL